jgi:hypothetical protein
VRSALRRHESRGLHFSRDYPNALPVSFPTVLTRRAAAAGPTTERGARMARMAGLHEAEGEVDRVADVALGLVAFLLRQVEQKSTSWRM